MLLSVVIPYYHVEKYIGACLERAARLDPAETEVLLVDDCGSDGSAAIAMACCAAHRNFRIVKREKNGGLSAARNTGLDKAQGEYVYFLDSDDLPEPEALFALAEAARERQLDIAKARFVYFDDETGAETPGPAISKTEVMAGGALFAAQCGAGQYEPMVWQCVYRRAFLAENALRMAEGLLFEDELFQAPALLCAKRAAAFESIILRYRQRAGSIMGSFAKSSRWCQSYLEVCRRLSSLADALEAGEAKRALQRRVGQIALSAGKNISAYGLEGDVRREAMAFLEEHKAEYAGYAMAGGGAASRLQGALLRISPALFTSAYGAASKLVRCLRIHIIG